MTRIIVTFTILGIAYSLCFQAYSPLIKEAKELVQKINNQNKIYEMKK